MKTAVSVRHETEQNLALTGISPAQRRLRLNSETKSHSLSGQIYTEVLNNLFTLYKTVSSEKREGTKSHPDGDFTSSPEIQVELRNENSFLERANLTEVLNNLFILYKTVSSEKREGTKSHPDGDFTSSPEIQVELRNENSFLEQETFTEVRTHPVAL
jgi:hypothetical protein